MESENTGFHDCKKRVCRACMSEGQNYQSIMNWSENHPTPLRIFKMLATVVPQLFIEKKDDKPKWICFDCHDRLSIAYNFQQMCVNTDNFLHRILHMPESEQKQDRDPLAGVNLFACQESIKSEPDDNYDNFTAQSLQSEVQDSVNFKSCEQSNKKYDGSAERVALITTKIGHTLELATNVNIAKDENEIEKPDVRNRRKGHYPCFKCGKDFDRPYRLRRHISVHSVTRQFECNVCKYRFSKEALLATHRATHDNKQNMCKSTPTDGYKCVDCPRRFEKRESLAAHIKSHRYSGLDQCFKCDYCKKMFHKLILLRKHQVRVHPDESYVCDVINKRVSVKKVLLSHQPKHIGSKPNVFECSTCSKAFQDKCQLDEHIRTHTNEKAFLCSQCGKSFKSSCNLQQHLLRHSGNRRYQCPECPSRFVCQSDQIKHMSTHRDFKPHVCDICGSSFTRAYTLKKHKYIHTGERPFKCEECNLTFVFIDHLRRHQRTHTGEKPYKCKLCERAYAESGDLNKHMRTHVGEKTYMCRQCPDAFKYLAELRNHQAQHYKKQLVTIP